VTAVSIVVRRVQHSPLETTAQTPALRAALSRPSKFNAVNIIIGTVGSIADIKRAASMPFISGIAKSNKTKSGMTSRNFFTPDQPSPASPQTVQCRERTMTPRMRRVTSESSTIKILKSIPGYPMLGCLSIRFTGADVSFEQVIPLICGRRFLQLRVAKVFPASNKVRSSTKLSPHSWTQFLHPISHT
jgi:hypothetical protein